MTLKQFFRVVEIRTKVVSLSSFGLGTLLAFYRGQEPQLLLFVLLLLAVLAVDMGTTAFNSFFDHKSGVDNRQFNLERDKVIVHEGVAPGAALLTALGLYGLAGLLGLVLVWFRGPVMLLWGVPSLLVGFLYNGGPLPLSRTPLGEIFAGGFLGSLLFCLSYFVQVGSLDSGVFLLSLPSTLLIASILTVNNNCDREGDRAAGRRTLSLVLGEGISLILVPLLGTLAYGLAVWFAFLGLLPGMARIPLAVAMILSWFHYRAMDRRGYSHGTKGPNMGTISRIFLLYTLAVGLSLGAAWLFPGLMEI